MSVWCFYGKLWTYFTSFCSVSIVDFEQVNLRLAIAAPKTSIKFTEKQL